MKCPNCLYVDSKVIETKTSKDGFVVRRRRECLKCCERFTTYEQVEPINVIVIRNPPKRPEKFNEEKIRKSLKIAFHGTEVSPKELEELNIKILKDIRVEIAKSKAKKITSNAIGNIVLTHLKSISFPAYLRYYSVFKKLKREIDFVKIFGPEFLPNLSPRP
jgi:transcriptional repressor NrdR